MWHDLILNGARALGRERATLPPIHLNRIFPPHRRHCDDMRRKCTKEKKIKSLTRLCTFSLPFHHHRSPFVR